MDCRTQGTRRCPKPTRHPCFLAPATLLLAVGIVFHAALHRTPFSWAEYLVLLSAYLLAGWPVLRTAFRNLTRRELFDENLLMAVATFGAIAIHRLSEAGAVMLLYAVGSQLQDRAVDASRHSIAALLSMRPDSANVRVDGEIRRARPEEVEVGQVVVVRAGERVPLDGEVIQGASFVDASALTGESVPRSVRAGDRVLAGMINGEGMLAVRVMRLAAESSVARILKLVEKAGDRKAPAEQFITAFSRWYTPLVVCGAAALAVVPPLVIPGATLAEWLYRALVLLVIGCPCGLVISIPLSYFGGVGAASRQGILVKGANFLDTLSQLHTVVFDKTGTLTRGVFRVTQVVAQNGFSEEEVLAAAAAAEFYSIHPVARSIREAWAREIAPDRITEHREVPGCGVSAVVDGQRVLAGNDRLLRREGVAHKTCALAEAGVHVVIDGVLAGHLVVGDEIKPDAAEALARLKELGVKQAVMLTGDEAPVARRVAEALNLEHYFAELLPEEKLDRVEQLQAAMSNPAREKLAFVGDGANDAPVITRADVGVVMGGLGSDAAIEAADVVLMEDAPSRLAVAVEIARRTRRIVRQNIFLVLGVKAVFLALGTFGLPTIWEAVFADVGVALAATLNATGALRRKSTAGRTPLPHSRNSLFGGVWGE